MTVSRRNFLRIALTAGATGLWSYAASAPAFTYAANPAEELLGDQAAKIGVLYGAAGRANLLQKDAEYAALFARQCRIMVPEGELKWNALRPSPDTFDFSLGDWLLNFCTSHNIKLRGHTLVWHDALPQWFTRSVNRQNAEDVLVRHIRTVCAHYAGRLHSWDVVNEGIATWDKRPDNLRKSPWLDFLGPDYIELAFRTAAAADPKAMLVYNQNHLETEEDEASRAATLGLLKSLLRRGVPIHALGIQSHLRANRGHFNSAQMAAFLRQVSDLGLKILVTEMDITDQYLPADFTLRDKAEADIYYAYLSTVLANSSVIAVLTWGLTDRYTWLSKFAARPDGKPVHALPFGSDLQPTQVAAAMIRAFEHAKPR